MTTLARAERSALCDLFIEVGPDAPTLCEGWATRDLAAHLVVRERRPDAAAGIAIRPLAGYTERVMKGVAAQPWDELVAEVRSGPPVWNPTRIEAVDRLANTVEYFVHHEDVRRGQESWEPRTLAPELEDALWAALRRMARLLARRAPCGVVLVTPDGAEVVAKKGEPAVRVEGPVGELVLFVYGRQASSRAELVAPEDRPELADQVRAARFGA